jgi:hypothetical protein
VLVVQQSESQDRCRRRRALKNKTKKKPDTIAAYLYIIYKTDYMCRVIVYIRKLSSRSIERGGSHF